MSPLFSGNPLPLPNGTAWKQGIGIRHNTRGERYPLIVDLRRSLAILYPSPNESTLSIQGSAVARRSLGILQRCSSSRPGIESLISSWRSSKPSKSPSFVRSSRTSHLLNLRPIQQFTSFSCTAGCLQSLHLYFNGQRISHLKAIELLQCKPHGAPLQSIVLIIKPSALPVSAIEISAAASGGSETWISHHRLR